MSIYTVYDWAGTNHMSIYTVLIRQARITSILLCMIRKAHIICLYYTVYGEAGPNHMSLYTVYD